MKIDRKQTDTMRDIATETDSVAEIATETETIVETETGSIRVGTRKRGGPAGQSGGVATSRGLLVFMHLENRP